MYFMVFDLSFGGARSRRHHHVERADGPIDSGAIFSWIF